MSAIHVGHGLNSLTGVDLVEDYSRLLCLNISRRDGGLISLKG